MKSKMKKVGGPLGNGRAPGLQGIRVKDAAGCLFLLIALPALALVAIFYVAGLSTTEWVAARPAGMSETTWAERRKLCDAAELGAKACATTKPGDILRMVREHEDEERQKLCAEDASYDATEQAKEAVSGRLKAPSTAKWSDVRASQHGCDWRVTGTVDAQNAFGGMMRSTFEVRLVRASTQTWLPRSVTVD